MIVLTVLLIALVFAVDRRLAESRSAPELRWATATAIVGVGVLALFTVVPHIATEIPEQVPAALIWEFRIASLAQLAGLWMLLGLVHGILLDRRSAESRRSHAAAPETVMA